MLEAYTHASLERDSIFNKKLNSSSWLMDAVTAWKCAITAAYRRLQALIPGEGLLLQSVPQCDWALTGREGRFNLIPVFFL